ncbi:MAG: InlB B-repeat-containing protein [Lachnospiraceae bacterium]|nr:InlB B-repeat-containing protein [Lachnospiraceae bacterium]
MKKSNRKDTTENSKIREATKTNAETAGKTSSDAPPQAEKSEGAAKSASDATVPPGSDTSAPSATSSMFQKRWFGRGIYVSKVVPICFLDVFITLAVVVMIVMGVWSASRGGYEISFDTDGGSEVSSQELKYGDLVSEPETPLKPGYTLDGWVTSEDESLAEEWDFSEDTVTESMTLYAVWTPAEITVKLDPNGGTIDGSTEAAEKQVIFGETYGELPTPEREGYTFDGWLYSGEIITEDTTVTMTGEHVLTAQWSAE